MNLIQANILKDMQALMVQKIHAELDTIWGHFHVKNEGNSKNHNSNRHENFNGRKNFNIDDLIRHINLVK